jgi:hypothetical protein
MQKSVSRAPLDRDFLETLLWIPAKKSGQTRDCAPGIWEHKILESRGQAEKPLPD